MGINKNGIIGSSVISNSIISIYDTNFYIEPDNSVWIRLFHHNNPASNLFSSNDSFTTQAYKDSNMWFNVALVSLNTSGKWEMMVMQKETSSSSLTKYRWIQTNNPMTATYDQTVNAKVTINKTSGYSYSDSYGGMYKLNSNTYLTVNNGVNGNWFGATGCWTRWNNGIPGVLGNAVTTGYMDLYYRIDTENINDLKFFGNEISAHDFIEY